MINTELVKIAKEIKSFEFPSKAALNKYLKEHPLADKSKHSVSKTTPQSQKSFNLDRKINSDFSSLMEKSIKTSENGNYKVNSTDIVRNVLEYIKKSKPENRKNIFEYIKMSIEKPWSWTGGISDSNSDKVRKALKFVLKNV